MVPVYICDDEQPVREQLRKIVSGQIMILGSDMGPVRAMGTPEELLEYYGEALEDHMGDLIPKLDYTTLFTRNGLVGVGDGAAWFGLVEDGEIRLFSLWSGQGLGVGPIVSEPTRG